MKTDMMDHLQHVLARHKGKGWMSYGIYFLIFLSMIAYVSARSLGNLVTLNKFREK
jgi:hypothetical protein